MTDRAKSAPPKKKAGRIKSKINKGEANLMLGKRRNTSSSQKKASKKKKRQEVRTL